MKTNIYFPLIFLTLLGLVACSKHSRIKSPEASVSVSGTVNYPQHIALPSDAVLNVILSDVTSPDAPSAIAEQTITRPGQVPIHFKVNYDSSRINPEHTYSVQACIRFSDQVRFATAKAYPVITKGHTEKVEVILKPVEVLQAGTVDLDSISKNSESPLQKSIHVTLAGQCRIIDSRYDRITQGRASEILPPELLAGPYHTVRENVSLRGPQYFFVVDSDFGKFQAQGQPRLRRLVKEINAIAAMKDATSTQSFKDTFKESALEPFVALKELVLDICYDLERVLKRRTQSVRRPLPRSTCNCFQNQAPLCSRTWDRRLHKQPRGPEGIEPPGLGCCHRKLDTNCIAFARFRRRQGSLHNLRLDQDLK
jgi:putative lipoprotein